MKNQKIVTVESKMQSNKVKVIIKPKLNKNEMNIEMSKHETKCKNTQHFNKLKLLSAIGNRKTKTLKNKRTTPSLSHANQWHITQPTYPIFSLVTSSSVTAVITFRLKSITPCDCAMYTIYLNEVKIYSIDYTNIVSIVLCT